MPTISVVMSVYNGANYLYQSINSILNQTYTNFEFIIINDCSTDETPTLLEACSKLDSRIQIFHNSENKGLTASLNLGLTQAKGNYIARQDADDISLSQRFERQVACLDTSPSTVLAGSNIGIIDEQGQYLDTLRRAAPSNLIRWYLLFYNHVGGHSNVMFRRKAALEIGGYDEKFRYSQDYDLWVRLLAHGAIVILPEVLVHWRTHSTNISGQRFDQQEHLSLQISQRQLQALMNQTVSLEFTAALRQFWLENSAKSCLYPEQIDPYIKEAYRKFSQQNSPDGIPPIIADRYIHHARAISIRQNPQHKLALWKYAAKWHFPALLAEWKRQAKLNLK